MNDHPKASLKPAPEQIRYARVLEKGMYVGLGTLFITFAIYAFGIMEPHVPPEQLPSHWTKNVHQYLSDTEIEAGWGWVSMLGHGDFINYVGIVTLAGVTIVCYLSIVPILLSKGDGVYAVLALLEVIVLVIAASGLISVGH